jgi:hypothetical protein
MANLHPVHAPLILLHLFPPVIFVEKDVTKLLSVPFSVPFRCISVLLSILFSNILICIGSEVLRSVIVRGSVFWDITPCKLLKTDRRFARTYCIHPKGQIVSQVRNLFEERGHYYCLFTAIGFAPGGSSPTLVQTKTIKLHYTVVQHNTVKRKQHNAIKRKHNIIRT